MPRLQRTQKIFPHLWYAHDAEAAAHFYAGIFPDSSVDAIVPHTWEQSEW